MAHNATCSSHFTAKGISALRAGERNTVKLSRKKNNFTLYIKGKFDQINAFYFQQKFYLERKNENDSIKCFLKSYLVYKERK